MSNYRVEMKNMRKEFPGVRALDDVNLKIKPGSIHALMGENGAGKSTLMKCLFGVYSPDNGEIYIDGEKVKIKNSKEALELGISMIHQELHPVPYRSVMDNIWLGRFPTKFLMVDESEMLNRTQKLLKDVELDVDPHTLVCNLSVSNIQAIEIAKAISYNSRVIIMDEPTSSLTENEVSHLFKLMRRQRDSGASIIYISHKMEEILEICDEVSIMRDGTYVGTWESSELTTDIIINKMVGRDITNRFPEKDYTVQGGLALEVCNLSSINPKSFKDVSFTLEKGEILGIGGLVGSQRTELVETIFGVRKHSQGTIKIDGRELKINSPSEAKRLGMALLTEERRSTGIIPILSILENTVIANQKSYARFGVLNNRKIIKDTEESVKKLRVKTPSIHTPIKDLSGGNQQKVLIARWLLTNPNILILDEPTRGIDVGAKYDIYMIMLELTRQGKSIIMISSEMPELLGMSDRVMVMCDGHLTGILSKEEATQVEVMRLATQFRTF